MHGRQLHSGQNASPKDREALAFPGRIHIWAVDCLKKERIRSSAGASEGREASRTSKPEQRRPQPFQMDEGGMPPRTGGSCHGHSSSFSADMVFLLYDRTSGNASCACISCDFVAAVQEKLLKTSAAHVSDYAGNAELFTIIMVEFEEIKRKGRTICLP